MTEFLPCPNCKTVPRIMERPVYGCKNLRCACTFVDTAKSYALSAPVEELAKDWNRKAKPQVWLWDDNPSWQGNGHIPFPEFLEAARRHAHDTGCFADREEDEWDLPDQAIYMWAIAKEDPWDTNRPGGTDGVEEYFLFHPTPDGKSPHPAAFPVTYCPI